MSILVLPILAVVPAGQTILLGEHVPGEIFGLDLFPDFIDILNRNAGLHHLQNRIKGIVGSMDDLPFEKETLDLIWSEGAIYNIGFQRGLNEWREYLKKGGYVAVSEVSWFTDWRPAEINDFWMDAYPEIDTIPNKAGQMQKAGYVPVANFILPGKLLDRTFLCSSSGSTRNILKEIRW